MQVITVPRDAYPFVYDVVGCERPGITACAFEHECGGAAGQFFSVPLKQKFGFLGKGTFSIVDQLGDEDWVVARIYSELTGDVFLFLIRGIRAVRLIDCDGQFRPIYSNMHMPRDRNSWFNVVHFVRRACLHCGATGCKLLKCKPCKEASGAFYYCSRECQRAHWKWHKPLCCK